MIIIYIMRYFNDSPTFVVFSQVGYLADMATIITTLTRAVSKSSRFVEEVQ